MKKAVSLVLAALLCALLLTACGESAQKDIPVAGLPEETPETSGTSEAGDGPSVKREDPSALMPESDASPSPPVAPAETDEPAAGPDGPGTETEAPDAEPAEPDAPAAGPDEPDAEPEAPDAVTSSARLGETPDAGHEYLDKLIFLGDSTTYGLIYQYEYGFSEELVPPSQVWTPAVGTMTLAYYATVTIVYPETGEELSIRDVVERAKPEYLVITLGVNGISFMDKDWFIRDYTDIVEIVKAASPETKIILNSIYPVAPSYPYQKDINNDKIRAANGWIEQIAADTGTRFLYSYESVVGEDGNLPEESTIGDGLHLSGEAFTKVMRYIRTHEYR